ncbi:MAG: TGS domain-containing protein [Anaerolineae bacterium]
MPTNLPPEYVRADRRYREAETTEERIAALEELISTVPKHKGTDHLRADLRRKLAELRRAPHSHRGGSRRPSLYNISREGAGQVVMVGPANAGKSALLRALTAAEPEVSLAPYTTFDPTPGMMAIDDIQAQLIDTPSLYADYVDPGLLDLLKRSDLALLVVDLPADPERQFAETLDLLRQHHIALASAAGEDAPREHGQVPALVVANKCDDPSYDDLCEILCELIERALPMVGVSAETGRHLDRLRDAVYRGLRTIRVYSKAPGKEPDRSAPFTLPIGATVEDMAAKVHRDFVENLKAARVWGTDVFEGQMVSRDHVLHEGDVVELHI